jgi:TRAP-type uncharacterized transport system fused permease subunit
VLLATLVAPALEQLGLDRLPAHLFVLYFGMLSMITPPVALASITAAKIAGADMWRTSWEAVKLAWVAYLVPFLFVFSPALLLKGNAIDVLLAVGTAFFGMAAVSVGIIGYSVRPIGRIERAAYIVFGILLMIPPGSHLVTILVNVVGAIGLLALLGTPHLLKLGAPVSHPPASNNENQGASV